jgi:AcrR family transcriptional regulator
MSPRPRKVSDDDVMAAAYRAMQRHGPAELTLAHVADEAGVTPGALVQRFGSKRGLLLTLSERHAATSVGFIDALRAAHASPLDALAAYADCLAGMADSPAALARSLAYLQIDLTDPDFRRHLLTQAKATRAGLQRLIAAAIDAGELTRSARAAAVTRLVETVLSGSLFSWAMYQEGPAAKWMRADLDAVLAPYRTRGRRPKRGARDRMA